MDDGRREAFWRFACESRILGFDVIVIDLIVLVLLGYSFLYVEPGSATYVISVMTLAFALVTLVVMSALFWVCGRIEWTR